MLTMTDSRQGYNEDRWIAIGWIYHLTSVVIYTERADDVIRIISARKATKQEVNRYEQIIKN